MRRNGQEALGAVNQRGGAPGAPDGPGDEWEKPWLLPQYRPLLGRILDNHWSNAPEDSAVEGLIVCEKAKLALPPPTNGT
jgi:hypothetical protein